MFVLFTFCWPCKKSATHVDFEGSLGKLKTWSVLASALLMALHRVYKPQVSKPEASQSATNSLRNHQPINMKCIAIVSTICLLAAFVAADKEDKMLGSSYGGGYGKPAAAPAPSYSAPAAASQAYAAPAAPSYAAAPVSIPAPPCPKNYLFSCQPNLAPVPCSAPAPSYGSAGAYSQYAPVYAPQPIQW